MSKSKQIYILIYTYIVRIKIFIITHQNISISMYLGFHSCNNNWCLQSGTNQQYTRCERVSEDGRTCYSPEIKYGSTVGGVPVQHWMHHNSWHPGNDYQKWCQQLFPTSNIIKASVTYSKMKPKNFVGAVAWFGGGYKCNRNATKCSWDGDGWWGDMFDRIWKDSTLDQPFETLELPVVDSVTCQI